VAVTAAPGADGGGAGAPAIEARGLTKRYGEVLALDALDLAVPAGSVFGFLGPNGAGKTTTLRLLTGLGRPTAGSATVAGVAVGRVGLDLATHIGYLDQDPRFYGWMTGRELLAFVGRAYGLAGAALRARVDEVLEIVGLTDAAHRRVGGYSGGMRQRLGVGQAMLPRPSVLFLDEPVSALDPEGRRDVLELIGRLRGTATVFMSTHILTDVERICDRVAILDHGRLVAEAPIDELLARHARPILELDPEPGQDQAVAVLLGEAAGRRLDPRREGGPRHRAGRRLRRRAGGRGGAPPRRGRRRPACPLRAGPPHAGGRLPPGGRQRTCRGRRGRGRARGQPGPAAGGRRRPRPAADCGRGVGGVTGVGLLLRKELREQVRTMRLVVVVAVFALLGLLSPVFARYVREIVEAVGGGQFEGMIPAPVVGDAVAQFTKNMGQFGVLIAILITMGSVATEKERGTAAFLLSKPFTRGAFVAAKAAAIGGLLGLGVAVAGVLCWTYTTILFEPLPLAGFAGAVILVWLSLAVFAALTFLASVVTRSAVVAGGVGFGVFVAVGILSALPGIGPFMPTSLWGAADVLALGTVPDSLLGLVLFNVALVAGAVGLAWLSFRRQEL
jgi:ABC-2 type transport system ATP-binding protein